MSRLTGKEWNKDSEERMCAAKRKQKLRQESVSLLFSLSIVRHLTVHTDLAAAPTAAAAATMESFTYK